MGWVVGLADTWVITSHVEGLNWFREDSLTGIVAYIHSLTKDPSMPAWAGI